jgi:hypothetical protein
MIGLYLPAQNSYPEAVGHRVLGFSPAGIRVSLIVRECRAVYRLYVGAYVFLALISVLCLLSGGAYAQEPEPPQPAVEELQEPVAFPNAFVVLLEIYPQPDGIRVHTIATVRKGHIAESWHSVPLQIHVGKHDFSTARKIQMDTGASMLSDLIILRPSVAAAPRWSTTSRRSNCGIMILVPTEFALLVPTACSPTTYDLFS